VRNQLEHIEQVTLFGQIERYRDVHPELRSIFAVPNGEYRSDGDGGRLKAEGVQAGVLDVCVPVPKKFWRTEGPGVWVTFGGTHYMRVVPGLFVEMKAPGLCKGINYGLSDEQRVWATIFAELGWQVVAVDTWYKAWNEIVSYLGLPSDLVVQA
jgi:hypothetical protein